MAGYSIDSLDPARFVARIKEREARIMEAPSSPLPKSYPPNALAAALHPARVSMVIEKIIVERDGTKRFLLKADGPAPYFAAGQFISVFVTIDGVAQNRPYGLASSPRQALAGYYEIAVQPVEGGLVSTFILENWKEGDAVSVSSPAGSFDYNRLRDAPSVIAIAGGSGITPFVSMARAIAEGDEAFDLTIVYGARNEDAILYREVLDDLSRDCPRVKVHYVLSEETNENYRHGFITAPLIEEVAPPAPYSVFLCGPQAMYTFVGKELQKLELAPKYIRRDLLGELHNPVNMAGYPGDTPEEVSITVTIRDKTFTVRGSRENTVEQILEQNGICVPNRCRSGMCGFCHSRLIEGEIYVPAEEDGRRLADKRFGYFHPCATFPLSDLRIEVPHTK